MSGSLQDVDLVLVEFAVNDDVEGGWGDNLLNSPQRRGFERLLRKLQDFPNRWAAAGSGHCSMNG